MLYKLWTLAPLVTAVALGLRVTPGSPCEDVCGPNLKNTTGDDIVCRDYEFSDNTEGSRFRDCVKCELRSTHMDRRTYQSDVKWGICKNIPSPE